MVADMAYGVTGDDWTLVIGEVRFGANSRAGVVGKVCFFAGRRGGTFVFFKVFFFTYRADVFIQVFFRAGKRRRTDVFIHVRTDAWRVAVGARESLKYLALVFLCAANLWRNVSILDELAGSVETEAQLFHEVVLVSWSVYLGNGTVAEG